MKNIWLQLESQFEDRLVFEKVRICVPLFYYVLDFMAFNQFMRFEQFAQLPIHPFWGIFWVRLLGPYLKDAAYIFLMILFVTALVGGIFYTRRIARIVAFIGIFQYQSYIISIIGNEHDFYIPFFVSAIFIFLPDVWRSQEYSIEKRRTFVLLFWAAQAYILLIYTMSGFYKLVSAFEQYMGGQAHYFSFDSAPLYIAGVLTEFQHKSILGTFILAHPLFGWISLIAILYVLLFSIWAALVPALHRLWGIGILLFHLSTLLALNLIFIYNVLFAAVFLLNSPFSRGARARDVIFALPVFGFLYKYAYKKISALTT